MRPSKWIRAAAITWILLVAGSAVAEDLRCDAVDEALESPRLRVQPVYPDSLSRSAFLAGTGTLPVVLSGLAEFVVDRAGEEAADWVLRDLLRPLCDTDSKCHDLFRNACRLQKNYADSPIQSPSALQAALRDDLTALPFRLVPARDRGWVGVLTNLVRELHAGSPVLPTLAGLSENELLRGCHGGAVRECTVLYVVGRITADAMAKQVDPDEYVRLLSENGVTVTSDAVSRVVKRLRGLSVIISRLERREPTSAGRTLIASELFRLLREAFAWIGGGESTIANGSTLDVVLPVYEAVLRGDPASALSAFAKFLEAEDNAERRGDLARVLPVAAEFASVETPEEAKDLLKSMSGPVGSWRRKRVASKVSFGALVGAFGGGETPTNTAFSRERGWAMGLFAPVGLDVSFPCGRWTSGVFLSAIDLGNVVSVGFLDGERTESTSNDTLERFIAPGAFFRLGVGATPFVLALGGSWSPSQRVIPADSTGTPANVWKYGVAIAVDVPLLGL